MEYKSFKQLLESLGSHSAPKTLAVAAAHEDHTLEAVMEAVEEGIVIPLLIGDKTKIEEILEKMGKRVAPDFIIDEPDVDVAAARAVGFVRDGKADFLMKGKLNTSNMLKPILNKETGLLNRVGGTVSLLSITSIPSYHKLLAMSDAGILVNPTLEQKKEILINAVSILHALGYDEPKVAVMAAVENVNPKMQETVDAAELVRMNKEGEIKGCFVEGPLSMDLAFDSDSAKVKGYESRIAGSPDVLLWPNVVTGNLVVKALNQFAGATTISIAVGAKAPLVITSRGASPRAKYLTIAVAAAALGKL